MGRRKGFPELADWLPEAQAVVTDHVGQFVRALVADGPGNRLEHFGSAVPAVWHGQPLLLTALHVVENTRRRRLMIEADGEFVSLGPSFEMASSSRTDLAAIRLPAGALYWGLPYLELDIQPVPALRVGEIETFIAMGFPVRETAYMPATNQVALKRINYWTFEADASYEKLGRDKALWLATKYERKHSYQGGSQLAMKLPHGMSGGALWRFWGPVEDFPTLERGALAGILIEHHGGEHKCMLSARLEVAQQLAGNDSATTEKST